MIDSRKVLKVFPPGREGRFVCNVRCTILTNYEGDGKLRGDSQISRKSVDPSHISIITLLLATMLVPFLLTRY